MSALIHFHLDQIQVDLDWRESELALLRKQLVQAKGKSIETALLRANLAMIYAHYEGFCKFALGVYIDALDQIGYKRGQLKWAIAAGTLGNFHEELKKIPDPGEFFTKIFLELESKLDEKASFARPDHVANLWPDTLLKWLTRLGLDRNEVEAHRAKLERLVNNRNQIAHGKKLVVKDLTELDTYADAASLAMHGVFLGVANALEKRLYARDAQELAHALSGRPSRPKGQKPWGFHWGWTDQGSSQLHEI